MVKIPILYPLTRDPLEVTARFVICEKLQNSLILFQWEYWKAKKQRATKEEHQLWQLARPCRPWRFGIRYEVLEALPFTAYILFVFSVAWMLIASAGHGT